MSFICKYNKFDNWWEIEREIHAGGLRHVADLPTKDEAIAYCRKDANYVVFGEHGLDYFRVGSLRELFCDSEPGRVAISNVVDGFNNLVCRAKGHPEMNLSKGIELSRLYNDVAELADFYKFRVMKVVVQK